MSTTVAGQSPTEKPKKKWRRGLGNRTQKTAADAAAEVERRVRRDRIIQLRRDGMALRAIAAEVGLSESGVRKDIANWYAEPTPTAMEVRTEENERLEAERTRLLALGRVVQQRILATAEVVDPVTGQKTKVITTPTDELLEGTKVLVQAADKLTKISASRRKLLGADAPEQHELSGPGGGPIEIKTGSPRDELLARLTALADRLAASDKKDDEKK